MTLHARHGHTDKPNATKNLKNRGVATLKFKVRTFGTDSMHAKRKHLYTNSVDPDETPQNAASHQGLRCLSR